MASIVNSLLFRFIGVYCVFTFVFGFLVIPEEVIILAMLIFSSLRHIFEKLRLIKSLSNLEILVHVVGLKVVILLSIILF